MVKLNVPSDIATSIIMKSAKEYEIDDEKVILLISEIQARSNLDLLVPKNTLIKESNLFGIISEVFKYLDKADHLQISLVSKQ